MIAEGCRGGSLAGAVFFCSVTKAVKRIASNRMAKRRVAIFFPEFRLPTIKAPVRCKFWGSRPGAVHKKCPEALIRASRPTVPAFLHGLAQRVGTLGPAFAGGFV